jgi:hypothetical protein
MHGHLNVKIICIIYFLFKQGEFLITGDRLISRKVIAYETLGLLLHIPTILRNNFDEGTKFYIHFILLLIRNCNPFFLKIYFPSYSNINLN